jgi:long-chain fatty acid transport protein
MLFYLLLGLTNASTYYLSDVGIRAFSRGGAFVAGADDISAQWYNPAALTRIHGGRVQFYTAGVKQYIGFDRADYLGEGPLDENGNETDLITPYISNQAPLLPIPHLGFAHDFGVDNLTVLFGFTTPYATDVSYDAGGPQRYSMVDSVVIHTFTGPSIAYKFADWVSVGVGLSWNLLVVGQERTVALKIEPGICSGETEDTRCDVGFEARAQDNAAFAWNMGLLLEPPNEKWAVGFMWQPKINFNPTGFLAADFTGNYYYEDSDNGGLGIIKSQTTRDDDVNIEFSMPNIIKGGILFRPNNKLEIELATVYEAWSSLQSLTITDVNLQIEMSEIFGSAEITDDIILPTNFNDSYSVRLGWEWDFSDTLTIRNGYLFETTGQNEQVMNVGLVDKNKYGYGLGASWFPYNKHGQQRLALDVGLFQSFLGNWEVSDSNSAQIAVEVDLSDLSEGASTEVVDGRIVGDGAYSSSALLFGLGLSYTFGD